MPEEVKILNGGLNQDDAPESLSANDYISAHNFRGTGTAGQDEFYGTNVESTTLITPSNQLHTGINKAIGVKAFPNVKKAYSVKYNSLGRHKLVEFDSDTLVESVLFTDLVDSAGTQIFNITPNHYFTIKLVHEKFLVMTDGISGMIYFINVERLKSGGYGTINKESFNLIKRQNLVPIKAKYISDPNRNANLTKGKLFQFRSQNGYKDFMKSAWSTISERPIPNEELIDEMGDNPTKLNGIQLTINIGNDDIEFINLASREALFDWYIFKTVRRDYIVSLPNSEINLEDEVYEAYNPITNEYTCIFYNEGAGEAVSSLDTDELYDHVPLNAGALEVVNGNILVLADIEEGYDRPENIEVSLSASSYNPDLDISITDRRSFFISGANRRPSGTQRREVTVTLVGTPKAGDKIFINLGLIDSSSINQVIPPEGYTVPASQDGDLEEVTRSLYNLLPSTAGKFIRIAPNGQSSNVVFFTESRQEYKGVTLDLNQTGNLEGQTLNILKSNSSYQLALFHFDKYGKAFPIVTGEDYVVDTMSYAETQGQATQIGWILNGTPPEGAVSYQWGLSENSKYLNTLWLTGIYDANESSDDYVAFDLSSIERYIENNTSGIVAYDFSEGDRVTLQNHFTDADPDPVWFDNPPLDFAVSGYEIKVDTSVTPNTKKYLLKIKNSSLLPTVDITGKQILFEIYTPKKNNESLESKIFYEIGEQYPITNGQYSLTTGSIVKGDAYLRPRKLMSVESGSNDVFPIPVEDFNFSDDYISNFWSAGRGRVYNDEVGRVKNKASFRYSDSYILGSQNNNINRFYTDRIYGDEPQQTSSIYGAIVSLIMRDNYLIAIQELKVGHIPVFASVIEDANAQQGLALSKELFNKVVYLASNFGAGEARKSIAQSKNGTVYFVDPNNGVPCRDGYDGLKVINTKMVRYFMEKLKSANPTEIVGYFDDFNNEYNLTFSTSSGEVSTISFNGTNFNYRDDYPYTIDDVTIVPPANGTAVETVDGNIKYTPNLDYVGEDSVGITFIHNSQVIAKNACIEVLAPTTDVQDFSFVPVTGQELEIWAVSGANYLQGVNTGIPISIIGGEYSINDGAWTNVAGTIQPNDKFQVRVFTSDDYLTTTNTILTIGSKSATFFATTKALGTTYYSVMKSANVQRNNCAVGQTGSTVTYTVPAGKYTSVLSQADADNQAQDDLDTNKQSYANANGTCSVSVGNDARSAMFMKNNCGSGQVGSNELYTVPANTFYASTKALANAMAVTKLNQDGQINANTFGSCSMASGNFQFAVTMYGDYANVTVNSTDPRGNFVLQDGLAKSTVNATSSFSRDGVTRTYTAYSTTNPTNISSVKVLVKANANFTSSALAKGTFKKNGVFAGEGTITIPSGTLAGADLVLIYAMPASVSLTSSDTLSLDLGSTGGGGTIFYSSAVSRSATKNDCLSGQTGSTVTLNVPYGTFTSTVSQTEANNLAINYAEANKQAYANANGTCTAAGVWYNTTQSGTATKNNCTPPEVGSTVTYTVGAGVYSSTISQADANQKAIDDVNTNKQAYANSTGVCDMPVTTYWNVEKSGSATRNNCGGGGTGSTVVYIVPANTYSSTVSQIQADNQAQADVEANKQAYANANGTCTNTIYPARWIPIDPYCET